MTLTTTTTSSVTTRSRTLLFLSYRDSGARSSRFSRVRINHNAYDEERETGSSAGEEHQGLLIDPNTDSDLPPTWVDFSEQVQYILTDTQAKIIALDKLHAKHVLPGFTDRSLEEREIEQAATDITKDFRQCQTLIQKIGSTAAHSFPPSSSTAPRKHEILAAKNVQRGLAAKVQDLSAAFRKKQRIYMEKLQGHATKNQDLLIASGTISLSGPEGMSAVDDDIAAASQSQTLCLHHSDPSHDLLQTRDRELTEIAKSISSLAELFKDLAVLVIDQGTLLDSVEYNIEQTSVQVQEAVRELDTATQYQRNTGRRKCIFLLLLIIFGLIIVLIFKPRRHSTVVEVVGDPSSPAGPMGVVGTPPVFMYRRIRWKL